jgi:hypothetical protein
MFVRTCVPTDERMSPKNPNSSLSVQALLDCLGSFLQDKKDGAVIGGSMTFFQASQLSRQKTK